MSRTKCQQKPIFEKFDGISSTEFKASFKAFEVRVLSPYMVHFSNIQERHLWKQPI